MGNITEKDFYIFRGTIEECRNEEKLGNVKDMQMFLAWDTHEIFFGNSFGKLVPYGANVTEITKKFENQIKELNEKISALQEEKK